MKIKYIQQGCQIVIFWGFFNFFQLFLTFHYFSSPFHSEYVKSDFRDLCSFLGVYSPLKGIVWGYIIFSASTKTNCWILELCIWLVRKLIGLPLLKRTPQQSKAEACYRQITCFYKKTYEPLLA